MKADLQKTKKLKMRERVLAHVVEHQGRKPWLPIILSVFLLAMLILFSAYDNNKIKNYKTDAKAHQTAQNNEARISITGDIMLGRNVAKRAESVGYDSLFMNMQELWSDSDYVVANLDTCVIDGDSEDYEMLDSVSVAMHTQKENLRYLKDAGIDVLSLATGHIADYGRQTIKNAVDGLDALSIKHVGVGENREEAVKPAEIEVTNNDGSTVKVAIFGALGHYSNEYGAKAGRVLTARPTWAELQSTTNGSDNAESNEAGLDENTYDPWTDTAGALSGRNVNLLESINEARINKADVIVVYMHWGDEQMFYEADYMRELARKYIDAGADIVVGTNPRVVLPMEVYENRVGKKGLIFYSIGTLVYDSAETRVCDSIMLDIVVDSNSNKKVEVIPLRINSAIPESANELYAKRIFTTLTRDLDDSEYTLNEKTLSISFG